MKLSVRNITVLLIVSFLFALLETWLGQWLWNKFLQPAMPNTVQPVGFWQFMALDVLAWILFVQ